MANVCHILGIDGPGLVLGRQDGGREEQDRDEKQGSGGHRALRWGSHRVVPGLY